MPFSCVFQLNNGVLASDDEVVFQEFIESVFGSYHREPVNIAKVIFNGKEAFIQSTCPCLPSGKGALTKGDHLSETTKIGFFAADGEVIPYDRPYATIILA